MNLKTIFFALGILLVILGLFMIIPLILQFVYDEKDSSFILSAFVTIIIGSLLILSNYEISKKINLQDAFLLTSVSWLCVAVFGSLPFIFSSLNLSVSDSFFESMSGITTTGSTIINNLDDAPKAILFWRAILQWLGGIGIIVMAITILPLLNVGGMQLFRMNASDTTEKILPKTRELTFKIFYIYFVLTFFCTIAYWLTGMNIFDGVTHAMTTIATGGFSNYNQSIGFFNKPSIELVSIIFIILGSIPFISYLKFVTGNKNVFFKDVQVKGLINLIIISVILMFLFLQINNNDSLLNNLRVATFNVVSILSGTGYVTSDFGVWGKFPIIFFIFLMFIGGCAGSTTCGIKIFRLQILILFISKQIKQLIYSKGIFRMNYNKENIGEQFVSSVIAFIFLYFLIFFLVSLLLSLTGLDLLTAISAAATCISNVGPGLGETIGPNGNFSELSVAAKWILSFTMIIGRLEIFSILVLFFPLFWKN